MRVAKTHIPTRDRTTADSDSQATVAAHFQRLDGTSRTGYAETHWIENRHATQYVSLLGGVPTSSDQEFTFVGGNYSTFGVAYLGSFGLADSNLYESGASGGPNVTLGDRIFKWNASSQSYDAYAILIDNTGLPQYDGKWLDELNLPNESTMLVEPGQGYWFEDRSPGGFTWNYAR